MSLGVCPRCGNRLTADEHKGKVVHICPIRMGGVYRESLGDTQAVRLVMEELMRLFNLGAIKEAMVRREVEKGLREESPEKIHIALRKAKAILNRVEGL